MEGGLTACHDAFWPIVTTADLFPNVPDVSPDVPDLFPDIPEFQQHTIDIEEINKDIDVDLRDVLGLDSAEAAPADDSADLWQMFQDLPEVELTDHDFHPESLSISGLVTQQPEVGLTDHDFHPESLSISGLVTQQPEMAIQEGYQQLEAPVYIPQQFEAPDIYHQSEAPEAYIPAQWGGLTQQPVHETPTFSVPHKLVGVQKKRVTIKSRILKIIYDLAKTAPDGVVERKSLLAVDPYIADRLEKNKFQYLNLLCKTDKTLVYLKDLYGNEFKGKYGLSEKGLEKCRREFGV